MTSPWNHQHTFNINSETVEEGIKESLKSLEALEGKSFTGRITVNVSGVDETSIEWFYPYTPKPLSSDLIEPLDTVLKMVAAGIPLKWIVRNVLSGFTPQQVQELLDELDSRKEEENQQFNQFASFDPTQVEKILLDQWDRVGQAYVNVPPKLKGLWIEGTYIEGFNDPNF
jgi:hypothetical protein